MIRFVICRYAIGQRGEIEITEAEYLALAADINTLVELSDVEEKFNAFIDNYFELERGLLEETLRSMVYVGHEPNQIFGAKSTISRRIINLLTSTKLYLDSFPQHANRLLSGDTLQKLICAPARAYDRSLSYRAMEALRNYAQHVAFPVHGWKVEQRRDDSTEPCLFTSKIDPSLDLKILSTSGKFKKSVLNELHKVTGPILLKPLIREYIEQLGIVHCELRDATDPVASEATKRIQATVANFLEKFPGSDASVVALAVDEEGHKTDEPVYLSAVVMEYLPHLRSRIGPLVNFSRRRVLY